MGQKFSNIPTIINSVYAKMQICVYIIDSKNNADISLLVLLYSVGNWWLVLNLRLKGR